MVSEYFFRMKDGWREEAKKRREGGAETCYLSLFSQIHSYPHPHPLQQFNHEAVCRFFYHILGLPLHSSS